MPGKKKPLFVEEEEPELSEYEKQFIPPSGWKETELDAAWQPLSPSAVDWGALQAQQAANEEVLASTHEIVKVEEITNPDISLFEAIMLEAKRRYIVDYEKHVPVYAASLGSMLANQFAITSCGHAEYGDPVQHEQNKRCLRFGKKPSLTSVDGGMVKDLRLNIMILGPPGGGKGVYPLMFIDQGTGIVPQSIFPSKFMGKITDAGLFGTVRPNPKDNQQPIRNFGMAFRYCSGFIGCEEFNLVKGAAGATFNMNIEDRLLVFLDRGTVETDMANGTYSYSSGSTLWAGNQTDRMWFGSGESGLSRRVGVDYVYMTEELNQRYKEAAKLRDRIPSISKVRDHFGQRFKYMVDNFHVQDIRHTAEYNELLATFALGKGSNYYGTVHYEDRVIEKLAIGYNIVRYWTPGMKVLHLKVDDTLRNMVERQVALREMMFAHRSLIEAEMMIRLSEHGGDGVNREALVRQMRRLGGYDPLRVDREIDMSSKAGRIVLEGTGWGQKVLMPAGGFDG